MTAYTAPVNDMMFALDHVIGLKELPQIADLSPDDIRMVLDSAGQLASEVLAPLNKTADRQGNKLVNGQLTTPDGFRAAYDAYRDGGWNSVPFSPDYGGQGLPWLIGFPVMEMWHSANTAFGLCPLLNQGAIDAIEHHGSEAQKNLYLPKLVSGEWTGTMNLTEPDAGSDLGAIKTKAEKQADGTYRIRGQKIFITYGEHDLAANIVHLVLARVAGAPEGTKGISLFIVPKFIPDANGALGTRNDVICVSIEHKLGIHASPTCTMQYGDAGGAVGYLVGQENEGLKYMFTMMNNARLSVGLQGVAVAERAYQQALAYARDRKQGSRIGEKGGSRVAIIEHPDVRRMLLTMKARIEAGRLLTYEAARAIDLARGGDAAAQAHVDLMTPVVKAWCTDMAQDVASLGVQIHGGMGYIEETGAAQHFRDARILPIYEGTNAIQALDLAFRKTLMDGGKAAALWFEGAVKYSAGGPPLLTELLTQLRTAMDWVLAQGGSNPAGVAAVSVPYLQAFGYIAGGVMMVRLATAARAVKGADEANRLALAQVYFTHILPCAGACLYTVMKGGDDAVMKAGAL